MNVFEKSIWRKGQRNQQKKLNQRSKQSKNTTDNTLPQRQSAINFRGNALAKRQCLFKVVVNILKSKVIVEQRPYLIVQIKAAVVHIISADGSGFVVAKKDLCVNESRYVFI